MIFNLAVNYGSRSEILGAVSRLVDDVRAGKVDPAQLQEKDLARHLCTGGLPDPDLLIRTSGEERVSNFLLWQMAYTEFWFTENHWPAFTRIDLLQSVLDYQKRERRYGGGGEADGRVAPDAEKVAAVTRMLDRRRL